MSSNKKDTLNKVLQQEIVDLKREITILKNEKSNISDDTDSIIDNTVVAQSIFENVGIGMAIIDKNFKLVKYNQTFNNLFGYSHDELLNMTYLDFIPEDKKAKAIQLFEAMFSSKLDKYQTEQVYFKKDKSLARLKLIASVVNNKKGEPEYIIGVGEDISEAKRQENIQSVVYNISKAVNDSQNLYKLINTIKNNLKLIIESKHFFISLYDESEDNFSVPNIIDQTETFKTFPAEKTLVGRVQKNKEPVLLNYKEILELQATNEVFIAGKLSKQWLGIPLIDKGKVIGVMGVQSFENENAFDNNDLTVLEILSNQISASIQKFKSEDALKIERAYFKELFDSSPEAIAIVDNSSVIININNEFTKLFGYSKDEAINSKIEDLISTPDLKDEAQNLTFEIAKGKLIKTDTKRKKKNGTLVDVSIWGTPVILDKGQIAVYGIFRDISDRVENEKKLKEAKTKAEESDNLKTAFLTNMSHEIRTPMNAIIGFSELMTDPNTDKESQEEFTEQIYSSSIMLLKLIDDIIDISQLDSGNMKIKKNNFNISNLLNDLFTKFEKEKKKEDKQNIELLSHNPFGDSIVHLNSDSYRLFQIFSNLISNALKYTFKGFIEYGFDINQKDQPVFYVRDTGIGIPEDKTEAIFDHFTKIEDKKILYRGTGIGLTITKKLINLLGGDIWVKSNLGIGSIFYFTIPGKIILQKTYNSNKNKSYNWIGKKILVAEDDDTNYAVIKASLVNTNANIQRVVTGENAVKKCFDEKFDAVLMDLRMPVLDGLEATKQIRKFDAIIPIIAQTAFNENNEKELCLMAGCNEYLTKPTNSHVLLESLNKFISNGK